MGYMPAPTRPGTPRSAARTSTRTPRQGVTRVGPPARPGEQASSGASAKRPKAVEAAPARGSLAAVLSWRTLVLAGVLGLAFALVWPSVRVYREQQAALTELRAERDEARAEVDDLHAQLTRWEDPAYVVAQARERLAYVFPGETPYRVVDPEVARPVAAGSVDATAEEDVSPDGPWFDRMWASVQAAGAEAQPVDVTQGDPVSPTQDAATDAPSAPPTVDLGG